MACDEEISVGDFVMSGGEIAAMAVIDATLRLLPGVLGDEQSAEEDSFAAGLLDYPHYTRPEVVDGRPVPRVLLEGNHEAIRRWRRKQALGRTSLRRPDLLQGRSLTSEDRRLLDEFLEERQLGNDDGTARCIRPESGRWDGLEQRLNRVGSRPWETSSKNLKLKP